MNAVSPPSDLTATTGLAYLPVFFGVKGRKVLLIGGGEAALAKLDLLRRAGAEVQLVWPVLGPALARRVAGDPGIWHCPEPPAALHFAGAVLAIDASGEIETSRRMVDLARAAAVPINVTDRPLLCDFIMPAILDRSPVVVAVSTGGLAPGIARLIRQRLETALPAGIAQLVVLASRFRHQTAERLSSAQKRMQFWEAMFDGRVARLVADGRIGDAQASAEALVDELESSAWDEALQVLDIDTDDPELLTVRAARLIRMAEVILYDPPVVPEVVQLSRRDAIRIQVDAQRVIRPSDLLGEYSIENRLSVYLRAAVPPDTTATSLR
jgi:uroporphyrin-III C-methyltransferase/precorrin-2 dehydrogenase/sirohydrochlorin ferrochelatase